MEGDFRTCRVALEIARKIAEIGGSDIEREIAKMGGPEAWARGVAKAEAVLYCPPGTWERFLTDLDSELRPRPSATEGAGTIPDFYDLVEGGVKAGMKLRLSDMTYYYVREEDKLLKARFDNRLAKVKNDGLPFVRQLIIDLVCSNTAILDPAERKEVAAELRARQDKCGQDAEVPVKYSRSLLRELDPNSRFSLLYAQVQSGKSSEQLRLIVVAWFALGVFPLMHMQERLVHEPQFRASFDQFFNLSWDEHQDEYHVVGLGGLVMRYHRLSDSECKHLWGHEAYFQDGHTARVELEWMLRNDGFKFTVAQQDPERDKIVRNDAPTPRCLIVLVANIPSRKLLLRLGKQRSFLAWLDKHYKHTRDGADAPSRVMVIFDEDDKQVVCEVNGRRNLDGATKYAAFPNALPATSAADFFGLELPKVYEGGNEDEEEDESVDSNTVADDQARFRKLFAFVVSITATPLLSAR
jgi:hypothetical protein